MNACLTIVEVEAAIAGLKSGKATGPEGVSPEVYKYDGRSLTVAVLNYCRNSLESRDIPIQGSA